MKGFIFFQRVRQARLAVLVAWALLPMAGMGVAAADTFTVINTNDAGPGSLRAAILTNNVTPGTNTIAFNITGLGVHSIQPQTPLPAITVPVLMDGYTQPGSATNGQAAGNNGNLLILIDGSALTTNANGLYITAGGSTVRGLILNQFAGTDGSGCAIRIESNGNNVVEGNFIGTDQSGLIGFITQTPDNVGIYIGSGSNVVGGVTPDTRNVVGGNLIGVLLTGDVATVNAVIGNYIGCDKTGSFTGFTTLGVGVEIVNASLNGVGLVDVNTDTPFGNLIAGNQVGVLITGNGASNNLVTADLIGTDQTGFDSLPNDVGVVISNAPANIVGGSTSNQANVISGNSTIGLALKAGATANIVIGNLIGASVDTNNATLGNNIGIGVLGSSGNTLGGTGPGEGNQIENNDADGIQLDSGSSSNSILGNLILNNLRDGVNIAGTNNIIGGDEAGAGNTIWFNSRNGITVLGLQDTMLANSIFTNSVLGIDLNGDGVTTNHLNNADTGPNNLQNYPVLTNASSCTGITIEGTLNSTSSTPFHVEFFSSTAASRSGFGEGQTLIGWTNLTTDAGGNVNFSITFTNKVPTGQYITSTATDPNGNTSEFSNALQVDRVRALYVTRSADSNCSANVTAQELDGGTTDPCGNTNIALTVSPIGPYPLGSNVVTLTATSPTG